MTAQAEECVSSPVKILQAPPLSFSPIKVLTPTKACFEPLHLSPWCNQTRPACPPTTPVRTRARSQPNRSCSPCLLSSSPECLHKTPPRTMMPSQWRSPSDSRLNPSASEFVPKTYKPKPVHNPLGGKLALVAAGFFERAYGLNGQPRVDHPRLKEEMIALTGCSERAVQAVLYGSSYSDLLDGLRAKVPGYAVQKDMTQDFTLLPFYNFDENTPATTTASIETETTTTEENTIVAPVAASRVDVKAPTTSYSAIALTLAVASLVLPFTFLC